MFRNMEPWMEQGACREAPNPDIFLSSDRWEVRRAKAFCEKCSVRIECISYALRKREPHGTWGGMDAKERERLSDPIVLSG